MGLTDCEECQRDQRVNTWENLVWGPKHRRKPSGGRRGERKMKERERESKIVSFSSEF